MQAIIMAAGKGSRLGKLTEKLPKSLVEIKGNSLLNINISMLHKFNIRDILIVTGFQHNKIVEATKTIQGIEIVYNPFFEFANVIGSYFMGMSKLHDDFVYLHADTICDMDIFEEMMTRDGDIVLPIDESDCDEEAMKVLIKKGTIIAISKEIAPSEASGEFLGIAKFKRKVIEDLNLATTDVLKEQLYASYFEEAIQRVLDKKKYDVEVIKTNGRFWKEIDFIEDLEYAKNHISRGLLNSL